MATLTQYYGGGGVPLRIEADPADPAAAWRSQRRRLAAWLDQLADEGWSGPTRCESWDVTLLVRHLASASQFLGYSLHEGLAGTPSVLLTGMDTRTTVEAAAASLGELTPDDARALVASVDGSVEAELTRLDGTEWSVVAEAPPGHLAAHLALSHFVWDSWVHEYDLLLPRGEHPAVDPVESEVAVRYLVGLVSVGSSVPLDLRLTDPELRLGVDRVDGVTTVTVGSAPPGAGVVEGTVVDVVDRASGRPSGPLAGDPSALVALEAFTLVLTA